MEEQDELGLLRALLRASDHGVLLSDASRQDLVCNRRFGEWFGVSEAEAIESAPEHVRAQVLSRLKDPDEFLRSLDIIYADPKRTAEDEIELVAPRYRILRRYTAPVTAPDGRVIGRLWTFADITRIRLLEQKVQTQQTLLKDQSKRLAAALRAAHGRLGRTESALNQTQQQLSESEKLAAVGLLAASVAHDIRNILTPLTVELDLADTADPQERRESLTAMHAQVDRLGLLVQRLLSVSRPAEGPRLPTDVGAILTRTSSLLTSHAALESVVLDTRCSARLPHVLADGGQLEQVLINLALNAIHAMQETHGGILRLTASRSRGGVLLTVQDTGAGMTREVRRRIFDPFFTTRPGGAGLGLFSCRRIVEAHGGRLSVSSAPNRGACVRVWLPQGE